MFVANTNPPRSDRTGAARAALGPAARYSATDAATRPLWPDIDQPARETDGPPSKRLFADTHADAGPGPPARSARAARAGPRAQSQSGAQGGSIVR